MPSAGVQGSHLSPGNTGREKPEQSRYFLTPERGGTCLRWNTSGIFGAAVLAGDPVFLGVDGGP